MNKTMTRMVPPGGESIAALTPHPAMFGDLDVSRYVALARQPQTGIGFVRRESQASPFRVRHFGNRSRDFHGAGSAGSTPTAMDRAGDGGVERESGAEQNDPKVRPHRAFHDPSFEPDTGHRCFPGAEVIRR
jgi:hypothetical protein